MTSFAASAFKYAGSPYAGGIRFSDGVSEETQNEFLSLAEQQKGVDAGKYYGDNGKYRVVTGNAGEAGWGAHVPPGYKKIGYTKASTWRSHPKYGNITRTQGANTLILQRDDPAPQPETKMESRPREPLATPDSLASARQAYDRANSYASSASDSSGSFNARLSGPDLYQSISDAGQRQNDDYRRRILPQLTASSNLGAEEVGFATRQAINALPDDLKVAKYDDIFAKGGLYDRLRQDVTA